MKKLSFLCVCSFLAISHLQGQEVDRDNEIDKKIETLSSEIHQMRVKELNEKMESRRVFRTNPTQFVEDMEQVEGLDKQADAKEKELQELKKQKH